MNHWDPGRLTPHGHHGTCQEKVEPAQTPPGNGVQHIACLGTSVLNRPGSSKGLVSCDVVGFDYNMSHYIAKAVAQASLEPVETLVSTECWDCTCLLLHLVAQELQCALFGNTWER